MTLFLIFIFIFTFVNEFIIINAETLIISGFLCIFFIIMFNSDAVEQALNGYIDLISNELTIKFKTIIEEIFNANQILKTCIIVNISSSTKDNPSLVIPTTSSYTKIMHEGENNIKSTNNIEDFIKIRRNFRSAVVAIGLKLK